jgi:hypothetical protein
MFGDDCCPAAKPGAWPESGPASQEPQPDALGDALAGQLAVNATPRTGGCAGVVFPFGAVADRLGLTVVFDAVGTGLPVARAMDIGVGAVVMTAIAGALSAVDAGFPQPTASPTIREAPVMMRAALRPPRFNPMPLLQLHPPRNQKRLVNETKEGWGFTPVSLDILRY